MPTYSTVPTEIVSSLLLSNPVTRTELNAIRDRRDPDRFQSVYRHVHGPHHKPNGCRPRHTVTSYRARVLKFFELGSGFDTAENAARAVCAFYKANYGARWERAFEFRKVTPWRLRSVKRHGRVIGYRVEIYVRGVPMGVRASDAFGRAPGASEKWMWATSAEAKLAARAAMRRRFEREAKTLVVPHPGLIFWRG